METQGQNSIAEQIAALNKQYEKALEKGEEFSILRQIKERLRELHRELQNNSNGDGRSGNHTSSGN